MAPRSERRTAIVGFQAVDHRARLESNWRPDGTPSGWYTVCVAPCTRRVPLDATFRAAGDDFDPSEPFHVPRDKERVIATSRLETASRRTGAIMIVSGYVSFFVVGPIVLLTGLARSITDQGGGGALLATGALLTLGGAVVGTAGVVVLIVESGEKQSAVTLARRGTPRVKLGGGFAIEQRGLTF